MSTSFSIAKPSPFEILLYTPGGQVAGALLDCCDPSSVMSLAKLNMRTRHFIKLYIDYEWNVDAFLATWFHVPSMFRKTLGESDALIAGGAPREFFDRNFDITPDLDIYVRLDGVLHLATFLLQQRYTYNDPNYLSADMSYAFRAWFSALQGETESGSIAPSSSILKVFLFTKCLTVSHADIRLRKIRIHVTRTDPLRHILKFHTST